MATPKLNSPTSGITVVSHKSTAKGDIASFCDDEVKSVGSSNSGPYGRTNSGSLTHAIKSSKRSNSNPDVGSKSDTTDPKLIGMHISVYLNLLASHPKNTTAELYNLYIKPLTASGADSWSASREKCTTYVDVMKCAPKEKKVCLQSGYIIICDVINAISLKRIYK